MGAESDDSESTRPGIKWLVVNAADPRSQKPLSETDTVYLRDPFHNFLSIRSPSSASAVAGEVGGSAASNNAPYCVPETLRHERCVRYYYFVLKKRCARCFGIGTGLDSCWRMRMDSTAFLNLVVS